MAHGGVLKAALGYGAPGYGAPGYGPNRVTAQWVTVPRAALGARVEVSRRSAWAVAPACWRPGQRVIPARGLSQPTGCSCTTLGQWHWVKRRAVAATIATGRPLPGMPSLVRSGVGRLVDEVHQTGQDVRVSFREDAVAQVEDVAVQVLGVVEDRAGAGFHHVPAG